MFGDRNNYNEEKLHNMKHSNVFSRLPRDCTLKVLTQEFEIKSTLPTVSRGNYRMSKTKKKLIQTP